MYGSTAVKVLVRRNNSKNCGKLAINRFVENEHLVTKRVEAAFNGLLRSPVNMRGRCARARSKSHEMEAGECAGRASRDGGKYACRIPG
eukprot:5266284-Pleurochrysis_carterae.AAC.1